jgi:enoyl-CoA hydratase/carnithine racemase
MFATYHRDGGVGVVTLDRPDRRNSIGQDMLEDLERAWEEFMHDDDAFAAVLVGNGSTFCAGRDIKGDMKPLERSKLGDLFVPQTNKPIVVGVQGHVIGLGWYMVSGCDYVVAGDDTSFAMTQLKVGLPGPYGFAPRMNLGPFVAFELLALGRPLLAERAQSLGLVNEVVAPGDVQARALSVAKELLAVPPELLQLTKQLLRGTDRTPSAEVSRQYWEGRAALEGSPNIMEARAAQRERRAPVFTTPTPVG